MKRKNILLSLGGVATAILPVTSLISCGAQSENNDETTFDVGLELAYAPYNFELTAEQYNTHVKGHDNLEAITAPTWNGNYGAGYDVYVANQIAEELDKNTVLHAHEWMSLIPELQANTFDAIIAGMTVSDEREKNLDFTNTYMRPNTGILAASTSIGEFFADNPTAANLTVFAQNGTTWSDMLEDSEDGLLYGATLNDTNTVIDSAILINSEVKSGHGIALEEDTIGAVVAAADPELIFVPFGDVNFPANWWGNNINNPSSSAQNIAAGFKEGSDLVAQANHVITSTYDVLNIEEVKTAVNELLNLIRK